MAGTIIPGSTNFGGTLDEHLYLHIQDGADFLAPSKGCAFQKIGVRYKSQLDRLQYDADPLEDYTTGNPAFASGADKNKRDIEPKKMTLSGTFQPDEWLAEWDRYAPNGSLTDLMINQSFLQRVIELALNRSYTQIAKLFWQGDTGAGGASPLRFFNGIITKILADSDSDVTFITPAGVITQANIVDRIVDMYKAIPEKFLEDPSYKIHMSPADFRLLNLFNNDVKKSSVGVLDQKSFNLFLNQRIESYIGFPKDYLVGARTSLAPDSNFVFANYFSLDNEFNGIQVAKTENLGKIFGYRVDFMADVQYRCGEDIVIYKPV